MCFSLCVLEGPIKDIIKVQKPKGKHFGSASAAARAGKRREARGAKGRALAKRQRPSRASRCGARSMIARTFLAALGSDSAVIPCLSKKEFDERFELSPAPFCCASLVSSSPSLSSEMVATLNRILYGPAYKGHCSTNTLKHLFDVMANYAAVRIVPAFIVITQTLSRLARSESFLKRVISNEQNPLMPGLSRTWRSKKIA